MFVYKGKPSGLLKAVFSIHWSDMIADLRASRALPTDKELEARLTGACARIGHRIHKSFNTDNILVNCFVSEGDDGLNTVRVSLPMRASWEDSVTPDTVTFDIIDAINVGCPPKSLYLFWDPFLKMDAEDLIYIDERPLTIKHALAFIALQRVNCSTDYFLDWAFEDTERILQEKAFAANQA